MWQRELHPARVSHRALRQGAQEVGQKEPKKANPSGFVEGGFVSPLLRWSRKEIHCFLGHSRSDEDKSASRCHRGGRSQDQTLVGGKLRWGLRDVLQRDVVYSSLLVEKEVVRTSHFAHKAQRAEGERWLAVGWLGRRQRVVERVDFLPEGKGGDLFEKRGLEHKNRPKKAQLGRTNRCEVGRTNRCEVAEVGRTNHCEVAEVGRTNHCEVAEVGRTNHCEVAEVGHTNHCEVAEVGCTNHCEVAEVGRTNHCEMEEVGRTNHWVRQRRSLR